MKPMKTAFALARPRALTSSSRCTSALYSSSFTLPSRLPYRQSFPSHTNLRPTTQSVASQRCNFATMSQTPSAACCNTPPIVSKGYKEKGQFITVDGLKTYTTGPSSATTGIFFIYDIFGFFPQTLQGADILATSDSERQYQVFMPDFFDGKPADISWYPPDTDEKGKKLGEFFETTGAPPKTVERIPKVLDEIKSKHPEIKTWAVVGYCWGGKIVNLTSQAGTPWKVAAAIHPAMVDANDAPGVTIPMLMIPSEGEDQGDVEKYQNALKVKNQVTWFKDQVHGFMAARADLEDPKVKNAYEQGYKILLTFFHENLGASSTKL